MNLQNFYNPFQPIGGPQFAQPVPNTGLVQVINQDLHLYQDWLSSEQFLVSRLRGFFPCHQRFSKHTTIHIL